ncbi:MAG: Uma2 family endonuclease [Myxococcales bacterium]|nr:Uma2 family endonuclease [Myxococcales bacterium]
MPQRAIVPGWTIDDDDPRSPPAELWATLTPSQQARIDAALPSEFPAEGEFAPEGDGHTIPVLEVRLTLERWFRGPPTGGRTYIGSDLPVYYPNERMFSPDIIAIRDVPAGPRDRWHVNKEGKGLDFVLEATYHGNRRKDLELNVVRFAALGIREYFVLDLVRERLLGYRIGDDGGYLRMVPRQGLLTSDVLGLDLSLVGRSVRFWVNGNPVLTPFEREVVLAEAVDQLNAKLESATELAEQEAERAEQLAFRAEEEALRAEQEALRAEQAASRAEQEASRADREQAAREQAVAELERLKAKLRAAGIDPDEALQ